ncbi:hypothetical protein [Helicobacter sp. 11S03491-1]|uniref:hypothetical protein n=1 Tax=Helicobacter sp. 11S03491-1 TaxID=1476196 RepID=UPI000BA75F4B|nr:hypothetical protein [Helicobacter sp. 11S03491-1]PAF42641.1 hypothetical protein BKH45_03780 [Helicobacter sp. 11S03491-1]
MKKNIFSAFLLGCISSFLVAQTPTLPENETNPSPTSNPSKGNNITGGLFFGAAFGFNKIYNDFTMPAGFQTYEFKDSKTNSENLVSSDGFAFEAKIGLMKTFKNVGIRVYGYYGKAYNAYATLGNSPKAYNSDNYIHYGYIDSDYYGGMFDLMIGSFQSDDFAPYFMLGGGYQFTHYGLAGSISLGDMNGNDIDIYHTGNSAELRTKSPVIHVGFGAMSGKHHIIEMDLRLLFDAPKIDSTSSIGYDTSYVPFASTNSPLRHKDGDLINITNQFLNAALLMSYSYLF